MSEKDSLISHMQSYYLRVQ